MNVEASRLDWPDARLELDDARRELDALLVRLPYVSGRYLLARVAGWSSETIAAERGVQTNTVEFVLRMKGLPDWLRVLLRMPGDDATALRLPADPRFPAYGGWR